MMDAQSTVKGSFDLILCLGNSLALLPSIAALQQTLGNVHELLSKDGYFISQTLNFEEIRHSQFRFFPIKSGSTQGGKEVIFVRFFQPFTSSSNAYLVFTGFIKRGKAWETRTHTQQVLQLSQPIMKQQLRTSGFRRLELYSSYSKEVFSALESRNLVLLAQR
jgi:hypothetical protein